MKRLIVILILTLSFQTLVKADDIEIDNLFGVKILSNIKNYSKISNGKKFEYLPGIITFENDAIEIQRSDNFDDYYLRTDLNYKIHNITAKKIFVDIESSHGSIDLCKKDKVNTIKMFSTMFNISLDKFENSYWLDPRGKTLYEDTRLVYENDGKKFILSAYCGYVQNQEAIISILFVSWVSEKYFKSHVYGRWNEMEEFDTDFIKIFYSQDS